MLGWIWRYGGTPLSGRSINYINHGRFLAEGRVSDPNPCHIQGSPVISHNGNNNWQRHSNVNSQNNFMIEKDKFDVTQILKHRFLNWPMENSKNTLKWKPFKNFFILLLGRSPGPTTLSSFKTGDGHAAEHQEHKTPRKTWKPLSSVCSLQPHEIHRYRNDVLLKAF